MNPALILTPTVPLHRLPALTTRPSAVSPRVTGPAVTPETSTLPTICANLLAALAHDPCNMAGRSN
jgi:hypothetical protein